MRLPGAAVGGPDVARGEQRDVDDPPGAEHPEREELGEAQAQVPHHEAVHAQEAGEDGGEQRGEEVVPAVVDAGGAAGLGEAPCAVDGVGPGAAVPVYTYNKVEVKNADVSTMGGTGATRPGLERKNKECSEPAP